MVTIRPEIKYDKEKCVDPRSCLECIRACPKNVLAHRPSVIPPPPEEPKEWIIVPTTRVLCDYPTCSLCLDACPNDALSITIPNP